MRAQSLTAALLHRLATLQADGHSVLSLYIDLDPAHFPHLRDRRVQLRSLLEQAEQIAEDASGTAHANRVALRADIERVRALFSGQDALAPPLARGLAIFASGPAGVMEIVRLPRPVAPTARVAARPFIEPLAELAVPERWCVLLVSRRAARILRGTGERLVEVSGVLDDVHRHHAQGGWSQARYQRGVEHEVDAHIQASCELLWEQFQRRPFARLVIGGPAELHHRIRRALRGELCERAVGDVELDVERSSPDEVRRRVLPAIEASERWRESEALKRLGEGMAPGGHAAAGVDDVLELLNERRVAGLLVAENFKVPGWSCPNCGWLFAGAGPELCPVDGSRAEPQQDIVENAIEATLAQDAEVIVLRHHSDQIAAYGGLAVLLRF